MSAPQRLIEATQELLRERGHVVAATSSATGPRVPAGGREPGPSAPFTASMHTPGSR
ncbi:hypothetical protein ABZ826_36530 [Streptomyces sp. NPDC047515]|uniref:hypothetical protein n=1 Tax=Streptomyces sp. NPDC047515 TaxID=3155380 RepID=UPI0033D9F2C3